MLHIVINPRHSTLFYKVCIAGSLFFLLPLLKFCHVIKFLSLGKYFCFMNRLDVLDKFLDIINPKNTVYDKTMEGKTFMVHQQYSL